ncbi:MAG: nucleotidyltransferase family protein [Pseudomonadota bacterium]
MSKHVSATDPQVYSVVLAAGLSRRFGSTKQLAKVDGESLVARAAAIADAACPGRSLLVVGHDAGRVIAAGRGQCRGIVVNDRFQEGIGSSIACAAHAVQHAATGLLITLVDQPLVGLEHLNALLAAFATNPDKVVTSRYASTIGPPAVVPRALFPALGNLVGDRGAKSVLQTAERVEIAFEEAAVDIDRPGDLEALA